MQTILEARQLSKIFGGGTNIFGKPRPGVHAVREVELQIRQGETLGIVGESGCGKSTLARILVGLDSPSQGSLRIEGTEVGHLTARQRIDLSKDIQYVFQDPVSSLNPRKSIRAILEAPLIHLLGMNKQQRGNRLRELMEAVNLREEFLDRFPHEFSGGQAQRIGIARALAANPKIIVLDEPVSALDVSIQAQVLNLLSELKSRFKLTYVFISHDLSVIEAVSDRVAVMYFGSIVEYSKAETLFESPSHPYTRLLLNSVPLPGSPKSLQVEPETVELPDPMNPPPGCAFAQRCPNAGVRCHQEQPILRDMAENQDEISPADPTHLAACHFPLTSDKFAGK